MDELYPGFNVSNIFDDKDEIEEYKFYNIPKFSDIVQEFNNMKEIKNYVGQSDYTQHDQLEYGIVLTSGSPNWKYNIITNISELSLSTTPSSYYMDDYLKTVDKESISQMRIMKYSPDVIGGAYNDEYNRLVEICPYKYTPGVLTLHLLMSRYIINQSYPLPEDGYELIDKYLSTYNLKYDYDDKLYHMIIRAYLNNKTRVINEIKKYLKGDYYSPQNVNFIPFPSREYVVHNNYSIFRSQIYSLLIMLIFPQIFELTEIVQEKEKKFKIYFHQMGVSHFSYVLSWMITYSLLSLVYTFGISYILSTTFANSKFYMILIPMIFFGFSYVSMTYAISALFKNPKYANMFGMILLLLLTEPLGYFHFNGLYILLSILMPSVSFISLLDHLIDCEVNDIGLSFTADVVYMIVGLIVSFIFYTLLSIFLDMVIPGEYGNAVSPLNALRRIKDWITSRHIRRSIDYELLDHDMETEMVNITISDSYKSNPLIEQPTESQLQQRNYHKTILMNNITKIYRNRDIVTLAVDDFSFEFYEDQIFVLLGHNGAGKTTLFNILDGFIPQTSGNCEILGYNLNTDYDKISRMTGVCLQEDILFEEFTVLETLKLFTIIKKVGNGERDLAISGILNQFNLVNQQNTKCKDLSGGEKRKLSVAIALMGNSKIIYLDEPTSGMDPHSRRMLWNLLQEYKHNRIIILTTHSMEEADLIGDRIGIMDNGKLICCGSSQFLKEKYNVGYTLTIDINNNNRNTFQLVIDYLKNNLPNSFIKSDDTTISIQIPFTEESKIPDLLDHFDGLKVNKKILSYGISVTTMEQVFLNSRHDILYNTQEEESSRQIVQHNTANTANTANTVLPQLISNRLKTTREISILLYKRFIQFIRDYNTVYVQYILPLLMIGISSIFFLLPSMIMDGTDSGSSVRVSTSHYNPAVSNTSIRNNALFPYSYVDSLSTNTYYNNNNNSDLISYLPNSAIPEEVNLPDNYKDLCRIESCGCSSPIPQQTKDSMSLSNYLLTTVESTESSRYGSILIDMNDYISYTIYINSTSTLSPLIYSNIMTETLANYYHPEVKTTIKFYYDTFPVTKTFLKSTMMFLIIMPSFMLLSAFDDIFPFNINFITKEKSDHLREYFYIAGIRPIIYWISTILWDCIPFLFTTIEFLLLGFIIGIESITSNALVIFLFFIGYTLSNEALCYLISYKFENPEKAQMAVFYVNFPMIFAAVIGYYLSLLPSTCNAMIYVSYILNIMPSYAFARGITNIIGYDYLDYMLNYCSIVHTGKPQYIINSVWNWNATGQYLFYLLISFALFLFILSVVNTIHCSKDGDIRSVKSPIIDTDITDEEIRVNSPDCNDTIKFQHIRKVYNKKIVALEDLSFGIKKGECFGLLGVNGAGKTTLLKIMTKVITQTQGEGYINKHPFTGGSIYDYIRQCGYCPQNDLIIPHFNVKQHLYFYCNLKGVLKSVVKGYVEELLNVFHLKQYEKQEADKLSGGNKRKLSLAISLIGNPSLLILDEPSTGIDPESRRYLWDLISTMCKKQRSSTVLLTTHSLEEAESLCDRISILVKGELKCIGGIQHIKSKYGQSYKIDIKMIPPTAEEYSPFLLRLSIFNQINPPNLLQACETLGDSRRFNRIANDKKGLFRSLFDRGFMTPMEFVECWLFDNASAVISNFIQSINRNIVLFSMKMPIFTFEIKENIPLGNLFRILQEKKDQYRIANYSIYQASLEQIFNQFACEDPDETN